MCESCCLFHEIQGGSCVKQGKGADERERLILLDFGVAAEVSAMHSHDQLFSIGNHLGEELLLRLRGKQFSGQIDRKRAMLFFFCKALKTYNAIRVLWNGGFAEDAYVLARTIYELRLQAIYLSADPEPRSKSFVQHLVKTAFGTLQVLKRIAKPDWQESLTRGEEIIRDAADRAGCKEILFDTAAAERAIRQKWWGKGVKGLAQDLQLEHEIEPGRKVQEYDVVYSQLSDYSHSGPRVLHMFVQLSEQSWKMLYQPVMVSSLTVPFSVTDWLIQIIGYTGRAFGLDPRLDPLVHLTQAMAISIVKNPVP